MTWATGIGYGLVYGIAITPWTQQPIVGFVLLLSLVMLADYGLLVPWGIFKPPWKEGHAFYFNLELYGVYCALTVAFFWAARQLRARRTLTRNAAITDNAMSNPLTRRSNERLISRL